MSKIRICDICGEEIEFKPVVGYRPLNKYFIFKMKWEDSKTQKFELCDTCLHKFGDFVNQEKNKNGNDL